MRLVFLLQGRIACANVLSDLYAMGVVACHNMLMLLAVSKEFTEQERDVVVPLLMKGFQVNVLVPLLMKGFQVNVLVPLLVKGFQVRLSTFAHEGIPGTS
jgi:hypothetical protein